MSFGRHFLRIIVPSGLLIYLYVSHHIHSVALRTIPSIVMPLPFASSPSKLSSTPMSSQFNPLPTLKTEEGESKEELRASQSPPLITVISATTRAWTSVNLYNSFDRQSYRNKKLIVMGEPDEPSLSKFWEGIAGRDDRVSFFSGDSTSLSIGSKTKELIERVEGEFIAMMDDDDYYAEGYLNYMHSNLGERGLVKLGDWDVFESVLVSETGMKTKRLEGQFWRMDVSKQQRISTRFGYGFTFYFRRSVALDGTFKSERIHNWDSIWLQSLLDQGVKMEVIPSLPFIVIKVQHGGNISSQMWKYMSRANPPDSNILNSFQKSLPVTLPSDRGGCKKLSLEARKPHPTSRKRKGPAMKNMYAIPAREKEDCCDLCLGFNRCKAIHFDERIGKSAEGMVGSGICWFQK
mmetsp:Transcript_3055/g.5726  ORF Transcript_3055/g.5726 Transcript_3055/m.5726 type:complete len:406 (-) Transcript_3055:11-1228(-)